MNNGGRDATLVGMISQAKANALSGDTTTSNIQEGINLYFTSARARSVINATSPLDYNSSTGEVSANGLTQDVTVVTQTTPLVLTSVLHFTNGILTSIT